MSLDQKHEIIVISGEPDAVKKACSDCRKYRATNVGLWCTCPLAIEAYGTAMTSVYRCRFWEPARKLEDLQKRMPPNRIQRLFRIKGSLIREKGNFIEVHL